MSGSLVIKRAGREEYGHQLKLLIAGQPGMGKTRISSTAPGVLYAATQDAGLMSVVDRRPPFTEINASADLELLRIALSKDADTRRTIFEGSDVQTIVIDTLDGVQRILIEERLAETKKEQLTMQDFGWLGDQLRSIVRGYRNLPLHVIFTVHVKTHEDQDTGKTTLKPALQGAMADEIAAYVDVAMLLRAQPVTKVVDGVARKELVRVGQVSPDPQHPWLKDRSGKLPMELPISLNDDIEQMFRSMFGDEGSIPETTDEAVIHEEPKATKTSTKPTGSSGRKLASGSRAQPSEPQQTLQPDEVSSLDGEPTTVVSDATAADPAPEHQEPVEITEPVVETTEPVVPNVPQSILDISADVTDEVTAEQAKADIPEDMKCEDCGKEIETQDQRDLSNYKHKKALCRTCFFAKKKR